MSDRNRAVQSKKIVRYLKFRILEVDGLYYPCSENKGPDQLRGYREAVLRLCFSIFKKFANNEAHLLLFIEDVTGHMF